MTKQQQVHKLGLCAEEYTRFLIECCICDSIEEDQDCTESDFAQGLYDDGWRYEVSDKFQVEGAMCPECASTPDSERGEY